MSEGYGSRIYKKRKRINPWPYIIVILVIAGSWYFFNTLKKPTSVTEVAVREIEDNSEEIASSNEAGDSEDVPKPQVPDESDESDGENIRVLPPQPGSSGEQDALDEKEKLLARARKYFELREYQKALSLYKRLADSNLEALVYAGVCYYFLDDYDKAYRSLEKALEKDQRSFMSLKYMAFTCYEMDDLENSLRHAEEGLQIRSDPELLRLFARLKREKKTMRYYGTARKPNFKVLFSKFDHQDARDLVLDILKEAYRTIGNQINFYPKDSITVILYNEKGFFDVTRAPGWAGGLYDGKIRIPIKGVEGKEEMLKRVLFHEYSHALVHAITPSCPLWINEGLAEYFSRGDGEKKIGQLVPLNLMERRFPSGDTRVIAVCYWESYSAVCHLIDKYGLYRVKELLEAFAKGKNIYEAFDSVFYTKYQRFLQTWGKDQ